MFLFFINVVYDLSYLLIVYAFIIHDIILFIIEISYKFIVLVPKILNRYCSGPYETKATLTLIFNFYDNGCHSKINLRHFDP